MDLRTWMRFGSVRAPARRSPFRSCPRVLPSCLPRQAGPSRPLCRSGECRPLAATWHAWVSRWPCPRRHRDLHEDLRHRALGPIPTEVETVTRAVQLRPLARVASPSRVVRIERDLRGVSADSGSPLGSDSRSAVELHRARLRRSGAAHELDDLVSRVRTLVKTLVGSASTASDAGPSRTPCPVSDARWHPVHSDRCRSRHHRSGRPHGRSHCPRGPARGPSPGRADRDLPPHDDLDQCRVPGALARALRRPCLR